MSFQELNVLLAAISPEEAQAWPAPRRAEFEALYLRYHRRLLRFCGSHGLDPGHAEDVVQDAFADLIFRWKSIDNPERYLLRRVTELVEGGRKRQPPAQEPSSDTARRYRQVRRLVTRATGLEPGSSPGEVIHDSLVHEIALARALKSAGLAVGLDEFVSLVTEALTTSTPRRHPDAAGQFREDELEELTAAGLDTTFEGDPAAQTAALHIRLLATALTVAQAATRLGVDPSRIRQRLGERTLYGVKSGKAWRLPSWQFLDDGGGIPGLDVVLPVIPLSLHPVAVWRWMTTPTNDLPLEGVATSPRAWLTAGLDPVAVAAIASDL